MIGASMKKVYEMPIDGPGSDRSPESKEGRNAEYSLEEQVRRTSESVERLAGLMETMLHGLYGADGGDAGACDA